MYVVWFTSIPFNRCGIMVKTVVELDVKPLF